MQTAGNLPRRSMPGLSFGLLAAFMIILCIAGGASRADVLGQTIVRGAAWVGLAVLALFGSRRVQRPVRPVLVMLAVMLAIALIQLLPLPPAWWHALPGRSAFMPADSFLQSVPWRPIAIVPSAALNAASSLVVPFFVLALMARCALRDDRALLAWLVGIIAVAMAVGLVQFSGVGLLNPFVNGEGAVDGPFANRNHYALVLAVGIILTACWGFADRPRSGWQAPVALGLILLLALTILASGSRSGIVLGLAALALGAAMVARDVRRLLRSYPRRVRASLLVALLMAMLAMVAASIMTNRAVSIDRAMSLELGQDMRSRALPTVISMIQTYFPVGSGLGSFDPIFRMHESFSLLKPTYFNHAHSDYLEIVLDTGLAGLILLVVSLIWWAHQSVRAWRADPGATTNSARAGSAMLFLVLAASIVDYPARTPMVMALIVIAAVWLHGNSYQRREALPPQG